jgi:hypothetical protein
MIAGRLSVISAMLFALGGVSSNAALSNQPQFVERTAIQEFTESVDEEFGRRMEHVLLQAQEGNPPDRTLCALIKSYGKWRFLRQVVVQVALAEEIFKQHPELPAQEHERIRSLFATISIAIIGIHLERIVQLRYPDMMRAQALVASKAFLFLRTDVEGLRERFLAT